MKLTRKLTALLTASALVLSSVNCAFAEEEKVSDWAKNDMKRAQQCKIIWSRNDDFQASITRGEFAEAALNYLMFQSDMTWPDYIAFFDYYFTQHEEYVKKQFSDVSGNAAANIAYTLGIVNGYDDGTFYPESPITRQEAAVMLSGIYKFYADDKTDIAIDTSPYTDDAQIGNWAKSSVNQMTSWNVMHGMGDGSFHPQGTYTKEQCYATLLRLYDNAPVSRGNKNAKSLLTPEQFADFLANCCAIGGISYNLKYRADTKDFTILYREGGHGEEVSCLLDVVYKDPKAEERSVCLNDKITDLLPTDAADICYIDNFKMDDSMDTLSITKTLSCTVTYKKLSSDSAEMSTLNISISLHPDSFTVIPSK